MRVTFVSILPESLKKSEDVQFSFEDVPTVLNITKTSQRCFGDFQRLPSVLVCSTRSWCLLVEIMHMPLKLQIQITDVIYLFTFHIVFFFHKSILTSYDS